MNLGGSYTKDQNGKVKKCEGTVDHPEGNRPRDAQGLPLNAPHVDPVVETPATDVAIKKSQTRGKS